MPSPDAGPRLRGPAHEDSGDGRHSSACMTPNAPNHGGLAPLASRLVRVDELPWERTRFEGIAVKTLLVDPKGGLLTVLLRMAPGAVLPDHEHMRVEQTW